MVVKGETLAEMSVDRGGNVCGDALLVELYLVHRTWLNAVQHLH